MSTLPFALGARGSSVAAVGALLRESGFDRPTIQRLLRLPGPLLFSTREIPAHERRLADDESPLATLVRLFLLDLPNDPGAAKRALGEALGRLHELGLVAEEAGGLYGTGADRPARRLADRVGHAARRVGSRARGRRPRSLRGALVAHGPPSGHTGARRGHRQRHPGASHRSARRTRGRDRRQ